tara:strand:- start:5489 stop:5995 length:507 start_codon:yes stop_codon:yes gene_type:complete
MSKFEQLGAAQLPEAMTRMRALKVFNFVTTPTNQLRHAIDSLVDGDGHPKPNFDCYQIINVDDVAFCWLVFDRNVEFRKINIHMVLLDSEQPPFLRMSALRAVERKVRQVASANETYSFTAFLTERSFNIYQKMKRPFFDSVTHLQDFYSAKDRRIDGFFGYRSPKIR